jgi:hypothetical protein
MSGHQNTKNPRGKKLNRIMTRIAKFIVEDTWIKEEKEAVNLLGYAILSIEKAQDFFIAADNEREAKANQAVQS